MPKNKYTVIGFYDSTGELFSQHVEADDPSDAVVVCWQQCFRENETNPDDLILVDVLEGHLQSQREDTHTCAFSDWPGIGQ